MLHPALQMHDSSDVPLGGSLPGSGDGAGFPASPHPHGPSRTRGTAAEREKRPDTIQLSSPSSESAATSDPILGGELVIRVIDAQVCILLLPVPFLSCHLQQQKHCMLDVEVPALFAVFQCLQSLMLVDFATAFLLGIA